MRSKLFNALPTESAAIRQQVFVEEQQFHNEFDDIDEYATHLVIYDEDTAVATGRLYGEEGIAHIGRVAVLPEYRGQRLGAMVVNELEKEAVRQGYKKLVLSAQCRVRPFYEKQGYVAVGDTYFDEYCEHIQMEKTLS